MPAPKVETPAAASAPAEVTPAPAPAPAAPSAASFAAAAASAFSTLPSAPVQPAEPAPAAPAPEQKPARILEDSFAAPAAASAPLPEVEIPSVADFQPAAAPEIIEAPQASAAPEVAAAPEAAAPAPEEKSAAPVREEIPAAAQPEIIAPQPEPVAAAAQPEPSPVLEPVAQPAAETATEATVEPAAAAPAPVEAQPAAEPQPEPQPSSPRPQQESRPQQQHVKASRPSDNPFKRRVDRPGRGDNRQENRNDNRNESRHDNRQENRGARQENRGDNRGQNAQPQQQAASADTNAQQRNRVRRPRDFAAATVAAPEPEKPRPSAGTAALAENVPVNTRPLDRVDEELIATGIIAGPAADSLTSSLPVALAVAEAPEPFVPVSPAAEKEPAPAPLPESQPRQPETSPAPRTAPQEPVAAAPAAEPEITLPEIPAAAPMPSLPEPTPLPSTPAFTPPPPAAKTEDQPLPAVTSDLPWTTESGSGWEVELPPPLPETPAPAAAAPQVDFFKPTNVPTGTPIWAHGAAATHNPPPELPGARGLTGPSTGRSGAPVWGIGIAGVAVAVVAFFIWHNGGQQNQLQEKVAGWTGNLTAQTGKPAVQPTPEGTFSMADMNRTSSTLLPPPVVAGNPPAQIADTAATGASSSTAQIDFADVPPDQANKPIMADGSEKMPEDVSLFAKFQQAVAEARANKKGAPDAPAGTATAAATPADDATPLTPEKLKEELSAYRRSLVEGTPPAGAGAAAKPAATAMQADPASYMDGKTSAAIPGADGKTASGELLPPPDLYTNNPKNLPIVGEPVANAPARIRTLADFEVEPFEPEKPKVRIPRTLKPKMAASDFPSVQVLSYVPGRGIIAYAGGREGVLLLGESLEGWELTNVTSEVAEFRAGQKRHYISANE